MADEPNILEQGLKNTQEFVDDNITGSLSNLTNKASTKLAETGAMKENQARGVLPWIAGGLITAAGFMLMGPINSLVKGIFSLIKNIVTGFGLFEKIPIIGEAFTWLGKGVETIGEYAGYVAPLIAGFIGYKAFETKQLKNPPPRTAAEKAKAAVDEVVEDVSPAAHAAMGAGAIGLQEGLQTRGKRAEIIRGVLQGTDGAEKPATTKQIARMKTLLGDEGFARMHRTLFDTEATGGKIDARLTKGAARDLIYQIEGLDKQNTQARIKEIADGMPKRSLVRAAINKTGAGAVAEMVSPDTGLSDAERKAAAKVEAAKPDERALIKGRMADQLVEDIGKVKAKLPPPPAADPFATLRQQIDALPTTDGPDGPLPKPAGGESGTPKMVSPTPDAPESGTAKPAAPADAEPLLSRRELLRGGVGTSTAVADAPEPVSAPQSAPASEPVPSNAGRPAPTNTGQPAPAEPAPQSSPGPKSGGGSTPRAVGTPQPKPGFWNGGARPGASATMGGAAVLSSLQVLTDDNASTGAKVVAGTTGTAGGTAIAAELAGFSKVAGTAGRIAGGVAAPFAAYNAYQSFTKENATGEDYLEGGIQTAYAAGGAAMLTGVGFVPGAVTVIGAGVTDIGHKGYKIGKGLHEISEMKDYIDSGFVPDRRAAAALASVQGRLREKLEARGVKQIPWGEESTMFDLRDPKDAQIAREELIKARDEAEKRMDDNNIVLLPRFFSFTDNQRRKQDRYESARLDFKGYEQALAEFDWYLEDQRTRLHEHEHKAGPPAPPPAEQPSEVDLGNLVMRNPIPNTPPSNNKDKVPGSTPSGNSGPAT